MEPHQTNWFGDWNHFNWNGLDSKQLRATKTAFKAMAMVVAENQLYNLYHRALRTYLKNKKLHKRPKKHKIDLTWDEEKLNPDTFFLVAHLNPPHTVRKGGKGGGQAVISPTPPPQP